MTALLIVLAIIVVIGIVAIGIYNGLVTTKNQVDNAWSDIDTQLKRRYDLIPNLIETVKGYAAHESQTFEKVVQARSAAMGAGSVAEKQQAEDMLTGALKTIFALAENYPQLRANENFLNLQNTLAEIEDHIQNSRRFYNASVRELNTKIEIFPNNIFAGMLGFKKRDYFEMAEEQKEAPKVDFNSSNSQPPETPQQ